MNRISINNVVYESEYPMSIQNNKVICEGAYTINGKPANNFKEEPKGEIIAKTHSIDNIKNLYNNFFSIEIDVNPNHEKEELIVTAPEAYHKKMNIIFNHDSLLVDSLNGNFSELKVTLKAKSLEKILNKGVGNISGTIVAKDLMIDNEATGNIKLQGKVNNLKLENSGVGNLNTLDLLANEVSFDNSGVGNLQCTSKIIKKGRLSGIGNVKYHADTQANISTSGLGNVKYLGAKVFSDVNSISQKPLKVEPDSPKFEKKQENTQPSTSFDDIMASAQKQKDMTSQENTGILGSLAKKFKKIL